MGDRNGELLTSTARDVQALSSTVRSLVFDIILVVIREKLRPVPKLDVWCGRDAPIYSVLPSNSITQIGDHLLSLAQV